MPKHVIFFKVMIGINPHQQHCIRAPLAVKHRGFLIVKSPQKQADMFDTFQAGAVKKWQQMESSYSKMF